MDTIDFASLFENIVYYIDEGIMVADNMGQIIYYNPAVKDLLGIESDKELKKLNDIGKFNLQRSLLKAAIDSGEVDAAGKPSGNIISFDQKFKHHDGFKHVEITSCLVASDVAGERQRLLLFKDVTDARRIEAVLNPATASLATQDPRMLEIIERLQQIAHTNAFILLQGDSGTGKTRLGRMIHTHSNRNNEAFIEINCAAIPESLLESELFGHVKGAFTGATNTRPGRFQSAHKGTLFLDEVGEIPLHMQAKLLRAIQDQEFEMVGSDKTIKVDVRIIAASNKNLRDMVDAGSFRADLFYRLAVIPITVPALKERPGDIALLTKYFCKQLVARGYPDNVSCTHEAMTSLMNYPWPGNVRELENAVEHGLICSVNGEVTEHSLPQDIRDYSKASQGIESMDKNEQDIHAKEVADILKKCNGNKAEAARQLGVNRTTLWRWIHKYNLE